MNTTIPNRCEELVRLHGGLRKAAESCDIDVGYFSRLKSGEKDNPTAETLRKLGLTKTVVYQYATPPASAPDGQSVSDEKLKEIISEEIGFCFDPDEVQPVNAHELLRLARRLCPPPASAPEVMALARGAWRAGITLGNNICVQESDRENDQDGDSGWINGTAECAKRIREWVDPEDTQLIGLLNEAGVDTSALTAALTAALQEQSHD